MIRRREREEATWRNLHWDEGEGREVRREQKTGRIYGRRKWKSEGQREWNRLRDNGDKRV